MSYCVQCGSPVPDGQRTCSMCYGDIDHGSDGYYRQWAEEREREWAEEGPAMPSETLLPCPFCGGEAARNTTRYSENCDTVKANGGQTLFHGVNCIVCGARTSTVVGYRTPGEATAAWNRRTEAATVSSETMLTASCVWTVDEDGNYDTACGGMFIIIEGTPKQNEMNFCCYCGRTLTEADGMAPDTQTEQP